MKKNTSRKAYFEGDIRHLQQNFQREKQLLPRMSMASGRAPRIGRKSPPMSPGPRISSNSSLPQDKYVAARNIR